MKKLEDVEFVVEMRKVGFHKFSVRAYYDGIDYIDFSRTFNKKNRAEQFWKSFAIANKIENWGRIKP